MKTMRKVSIFKVVALTFLAVGCLVSCNQNGQNGPTVNEMQTRLNDIMKEYQEMQATCDDYTRQLAEKDSSIQAQAAEIQRLIDQLNNAGTKGNRNVKATRSGSKANSAKLKKLNAELAARKAEINRLQERLNQQTYELNALKAADGYADREALVRLQMLVKDQENRIIALTNDKVALTNINDSLVAHVAYLMGVRAESEKTTNAEYAAQVSILQNQVANQQNEINRLREELAKQTALANDAAKNASNNEAETKASVAKTKGSINKKLAQLQAQCDEYYEELERLRAENIILKNENDSLRSEVNTMKKNVENVAVENAKMAAKVSRASVLSTSELNVTPLKRLSNGTGKPTSRASATHAFRIEGYLMGNSVVEPGTITVYAVITSPSNAVLHNGTVEQKFDANGVRTTYTMVQAYEFTGQTRPFEMSWSCDDQLELEAGVYRLNLYANGNLIGVTEFKLK
jgi:predicted RNase H-like nuclease (RuvC/YqgF family)